MARFGKRTATVLATLIALTLAGCGGSGDAASDGDTVSYGGQTIVPDLVFRGKDWGKSHDITIDQHRFPSGSEAFQALLSGDVNVSNGGSGRLITIAAQQPDAIKLIAKWQYGGNRYSVLTPQGTKLQAAEDLVGKRVAVDKGSGAFTLFEAWLRDNGVDPSKVTMVQTKIADIGSALESESADVGVAWEPTASLLVHKKIANRMTTLKSAGQSPNYLIVRKQWAQDHRDQLVKFLKAAVDVGDFIAKNPDGAGKMAAKVSSGEGVEMPAAALADALRHIEMAPQIDQASLDELTDLAKQQADAGTIPEVPDFEALVDNSYLKEATGK